MIISVAATSECRWHMLRCNVGGAEAALGSPLHAPLSEVGGAWADALEVMATTHGRSGVASGAGASLFEATDAAANEDSVMALLLHPERFTDFAAIS